MDIKLIIILVLIILSFYQFTHADTQKEKLDPYYGKAISWWDQNNPFNKDSSTCTDEISYVCGGNGVTYDNSCKAALAGISAVTPGACV